VCHFCHFLYYMDMENVIKKDPNNWNEEERDRVVGVFKILLEMDKKQNPHLYTKTPTLEKGRDDIIKKP
jgi:hypothetical protein